MACALHRLPTRLVSMLSLLIENKCKSSPVTSTHRNDTWRLPVSCDQTQSVQTTASHFAAYSHPPDRSISYCCEFHYWKRILTKVCLFENHESRSHLLRTHKCARFSSVWDAICSLELRCFAAVLSHSCKPSIHAASSNLDSCSHLKSRICASLLSLFFILRMATLVGHNKGFW
jgi:hypothetical protein